MISARTARIDNNLGRGTDGSIPLSSSGESGANLWIDQEIGLPLHLPLRLRKLFPTKAVARW
jgi:hypothetical protein